MSASELDALLADEIARRLPLLTDDNSALIDQRAALHSLRGATAMAGHTDLALVLAQLSSRLRSGERQAAHEAHAILRRALERLLRGEKPLGQGWPEPPLGLSPSSVDERYRAEYHAAMRDRLGELDAVLASTQDLSRALDQAQRTVHAMKGASAGAADDVTAWYCHGLEARLRQLPRDEKTARDALVELARHRALLSLLVEDPSRGLELLRVTAAASDQAPGSLVPGPRPGTVPPTQPPMSDPPNEAELRIPERTLERFLERLERIDGVHDGLASGSDLARRMSVRLLELRLNVLDAMRQIGPARPWGPPSAALQQLELTAEALRRAAARAERGARVYRSDALTLRARVGAMRSELAELRRASLSWLFERVKRAADRFAHAGGKLVRIETAGAEVLVERRVIERLLDPVLQLVRNAIAHGIGSPEERERAGKPPRGTIALRAERRGAWLRLQVEDDGRGADVERVRELVVQRGIVNAELAARAGQDELLGLLFAPGLSTAEGSDLLAGRGIGLDLVQDALRRLGGAATLEQISSGGLRAVLDVPLDPKVVDVLWVEDGGHEYALPVSYTGRVLPRAALPGSQRLAHCLGLHTPSTGRLVVELLVHGLERVLLAVDAVGSIEEASIRAIGPLLGAAGPYSGAVLRSDGSLRLVLDGPLLAARVRALGSAPP